MMKFSVVKSYFSNIWFRRSSKAYIDLLRSFGIEIGGGCIFRGPHTTRDASNAEQYEREGVPLHFQLSEAYDDWMSTHKAQFPSYESFIEYVNNTKMD